jgi:NhaA family Na+:H+ antiporter
MSHSNGNRYISLLQEFSIPLLAGVVVALLVANASPKLYDQLVYGTYSFFTGEEYEGHGHGGHEGEHSEPGHDESHGDGHDTADHSDESQADDQQTVAQSDSSHSEDDWWKHFLTMHFLINEVFMVVFFGIAAKEITESCLPGGALNPVSKAINPLLGTIGGVVGPVGAFFVLNAVMGQPSWNIGWGIPTATDIALAWLVARMVFGNGHPAVAFLLLLAVADDAIGLGIIAIFYPNPDHPTEWFNTWWVLPGMAVAYAFRRMKIRNWIPYVLIGGGLSWWGLFSAHLHPALALVPIVPLIPGPTHDEGLFQDDASTVETDPLNKFEHDLKLFVDFGLFFFAFANAGVQFSNVNNLTWIIFLALLVGKTVGISAFSFVGKLIGFPLPTGMNVRHLIVAGVVAGIGLTVALFVAGQAFAVTDPSQGASKMGALFSGGIALIALIVGKSLGVKDGAKGT